MKKTLEYLGQPNSVWAEMTYNMDIKKYRVETIDNDGVKRVEDVDLPDPNIAMKYESMEKIRVLAIVHNKR